MKKVLFLTFLIASCYASFGQSCNNSVSGTYGKQLPVYAQLENLPGGGYDTLCWYLNKVEILALLPTTASITIYGGGSGEGTATVPAGTVIKGISVKNLTRPTAPFTDEVVSVPVWNVSGTTLTIYLQTAAMAIPSNDYLITYIY